MAAYNLNSISYSSESSDGGVQRQYFEPLIEQYTSFRKYSLNVCLVNIIFAVFYLYSNSILVFLAITEGSLYAFITEGLYWYLKEMVITVKVKLFDDILSAC